MSSDKDHLSEKLRDREKGEEERYFLEQSKKQIEKLRAMREQAAAAGNKADCPRCGTPLEVKEMRGVAIEACPTGHGIWLDQGELEQITKREGDSWLARIIFGAKG